MKFVVQVRPYPRPHHEANVLIQVFDDDDVNRLVRWFDHNCLETNVHRLDDDDDVVDLAAADQLIMTLANPDEPPGYTRSIAQAGEGDPGLEKALAVVGQT